jgi:hypothetical protein
MDSNPGSVVVALLLSFGGALAQGTPDFPGTWIIDQEHSGPAKEVWTQTRSDRFIMRQEAGSVSIDTADGSMFGMSASVTTEPLNYRLDGKPTVIIDHSLGDLPNFVRKIRTEARWEGSKLVTLTTQVSESDGVEHAAVTRVLTFELVDDGRRMIVERTGYRNDKPSTVIPRIMHHGGMEDDLVYARDRAIYIKSAKAALKTAGIY